MIKIIISFLFVAACAAPVSCGEFLPSSDSAFFSALNDIKSTVSQMELVQIEPPIEEPVPISEKEASYIRVSGHLHLQGQSTIPHGSNFVSMNLSGFAEIRDASGRITSRRVHISCWAHTHISGSFVSTWVYPNVYVSFYEDGKYVGRTRVNGNIFVTGHVSGSWLRLSGSGTIYGHLTIQEP